MNFKTRWFLLILLALVFAIALPAFGQVSKKVKCLQACDKAYKDCMNYCDQSAKPADKANCKNVGCKKLIEACQKNCDKKYGK